MAWVQKSYATKNSIEVNLSKNDREILKAAFKDNSKGNVKKYYAHSKRLSDPLARKILLYYHLMSRGTSGSFKQITSFIRDNPHWPNINSMRARAEEAMSNDLSPQEILTYFGSVYPISTEGWIQYIRALVDTGNINKARRIIRETWTNKNFSKRPEQYFYKRYRQYLTKKDHLNRLDRLLWEGKHWPARRMLWKVSSEHRAQAEARLMLRHRFGNVDKAIAKVPTNQLHNPGLVFERLRWRRKKGRYEQSLDLITKPPTNLVYPEKWWTERTHLARTALNKGHVTTAYDLVKNHQLDGGASFADAEWLAGWIALRFLEEPEIATKHFERMYKIVKYPISQARGAYWIGRAAEFQGKQEIAKKWFNIAASRTTTYYGQLAASHLSPKKKLTLPIQSEPTSMEINIFQNLDLVKAVNILSAVKAQKQLKDFIIALSNFRPTTGWQLLTARMAIQHGRPDLGIIVAKKSSRMGEELIEVGYPILETPVVQTGFSKISPEIPLVLAIIRQESAFFSRAKSHANAQGLMQILPSTAKKVAKLLQVKFSSERLISDPKYNMKLGQAYLAKLIEEFEGSYVMALAGYNAGPGRALKWAKKYGSPRGKVFNTIDWIEIIPFKETRNYIQRVLENLQIYRMIQQQSSVIQTLEQDLTR